MNDWLLVLALPIITDKYRLEEGAKRDWSVVVLVAGFLLKN